MRNIFRSYFLYLILPFFFLLTNSCTENAKHSLAKISWPNGAKGVICLTYDDGIESHLNNAIPQLNEAKLTGTFFVDGRIRINQFDAWRAATENGHEIANHTVYHPCSQSFDWVSPQTATENYTVDRMLKEIGTLNQMLYAIDSNQIHSFAFPCSAHEVGGKNYVENLRKSNLVSFARTGSSAGDKAEDQIVTDFSNLDLLQVPSWGIPQDTPAEQLIQFAEAVKNKEGLGVMMFHGIGGDYITVANEDHQKLLEYLNTQQSEIWVTTFSEALNYIKTQTEQ
ncbi:MAG: polysaccharide deacetylase [Thalassobius sp.]|nr:polysaccharide deacetylase [Thalassovita sp.]